MSHSTHKMLIEFEAAVDLEIGFVFYCNTLEDQSAFNHLFLMHDLNHLRHIRYHDPNFLPCLFRPRLPYDTARGIFKDTLKEHYQEIIELSPEVIVTKRLLNVIKYVEKGSVGECHILVTKPQEIAILKKLYPTATIIDGSGNRKIDFNSYARIIVSDPENCIRYKECRFKHIALIKYPQNFEVINGVTIANKTALALLGSTNQIELISPY